MGRTLSFVNNKGMFGIVFKMMFSENKNENKNGVL